jgi:hypothetical protein
MLIVAAHESALRPFDSKLTLLPGRSPVVKRKILTTEVITARVYEGTSRA